MPILLKDITRVHELLPIWFRECTPKILVITDNLNYNALSDFGLTRFVDALRASTIHSMTPIVRTARYVPGAAAPASLDAATQHISNFQFADAQHGLLKSRYDAVFLLAINREGSPGLAQEPAAMSAITTFMQQGGGLFATGDHEDLGAAMCMTIPRVRAMRRWAAADTPNGANTSRLSTNLAGANDVYEFNDQADALPQRLYVNYRTQAGGVGLGHPVLQVPGTVPPRAIEVFPDHPHEGECLLPTALNTKLPDGLTDEWPSQTGGGARVVPEAIALTVSHGDNFGSKAALAPRSFIPISAYDGQRADVGRVVTDATWHHFVNINLISLAGRNLSDVKQYYTNLATWLMPKHVRRCSRWPLLVLELVRYPLFEEFKAIPIDKIDGRELRDSGALVEQALLQRHSAAVVQAVMDDALDEALGAKGLRALADYSKRFGEVSARDTGLAALAGMAQAAVDTANSIDEREKKDALDLFEKAGAKAARAAVLRYLSDARKELRMLDDVLGTMLH